MPIAEEIEETGLVPICDFGTGMSHSYLQSRSPLLSPVHSYVQSTLLIPDGDRPLRDLGNALSGTTMAKEQFKHKKGTIGEKCMMVTDGKDMYTSGMVCCLIICDGEYGMQ